LSAVAVPFVMVKLRPVRYEERKSVMLWMAVALSSA
jgi:hypothetical protein